MLLTFCALPFLLVPFFASVVALPHPQATPQAGRQSPIRNAVARPAAQAATPAAFRRSIPYGVDGYAPPPAPTPSASALPLVDGEERKGEDASSSSASSTDLPSQTIEHQIKESETLSITTGSYSVQPTDSITTASPTESCTANAQATVTVTETILVIAAETGVAGGNDHRQHNGKGFKKGNDNLNVQKQKKPAAGGAAKQDTNAEEDATSKVNGYDNAVASGHVFHHEAANSGNVLHHESANSGSVFHHDAATSENAFHHEAANSGNVLHHEAANSGSVFHHDASTSGNAFHHEAANSGNDFHHEAANSGSVFHHDAATSGNAFHHEAANP